MDKIQSKKIKISFFSEDEYGRVVGKELEARGYNVRYDSLDEDTNICFVMCCPASFRFNSYLKKRWELERFVYRGKIVLNVLDIPIWRFKEPCWKNYYELYRKSLVNADYITTISKFTGDELKVIWNLESTPLFTVFNNKIVKKYKKSVKRDKKLIVAVSRFVEHKRFELIIKALEGTDMKLIIIGKGGYMKSFYEQLSKQLDVDCTIYSNSDTKFIIEQMCNAKLCIHPSTFEGFSLVPKEALWCDTPVIISDIPVHREFHGDSVVYCKPNDLDDLKEKLFNVPLISPRKGKKLLKKLTIEKVTDDVEAWLEDNINENNNNR